ncbi:WEB family protein [Salvia divinorum]|uniref:WEB family protein n=1 Tax=Salvia divinorum TaxID=28513 RepID=A0ABD1GSL0_SALDI
MENQHQPALEPDNQTTAPLADHRSSVDSSRPFRSVKEAVAIFGERFLAGEIYSPKPFEFPKKETPFFSPAPEHDGQLPPPNPSGAAEALADSVKKLETELEETKAELKLLKDRESETEVAVASLNAELHRNMSKMARAEAAAAAKAVGRGPSPSLAQVLSVEEEKISKLLGGKKKERRETMKKKKPIIPLVGDLFWKKKKSAATLHNPLYASSHLL